MGDRIFLVSLLILNVLGGGGGGGNGTGIKNKKKLVTSNITSLTAQNNNNERKKKEHGIKPKETKRQSGLPLVAVLYDSVLNGVQSKRLGRSYGFEVTKQKTKKKEIILEQKTQKMPAKIIVI